MLAKIRLPHYLSTMSATHPRPQIPPAETDEQRHSRLAEEERLLDEAEAEAAAGLLIPQADANAWINSLGTANPLPMPQPRKPD
ncbi:MAG TPA: hypothetical protein VLI93_05240 [Acetobacteraceae bacterium]|nr:hypothetical protein [Acetobacteraceae bacterium]